MKQLSVALVALVVVLAIVGCSEPISLESAPSAQNSGGRAGADSLLRGATPANLKVPAGWTLVRTQDFESGGVPTDEFIHPGTAITAANPHSGVRSLQGTFTGDGSSVRWALTAGVLGSFSESYVSFWDYVEPQARFNDEFTITRWDKRNGAGALDQEVIVDNFSFGHSASDSGFNTTTPVMEIVVQSNTSSGVINTFWSNGRSNPIGLASWTQWETHYRPNTPGNSDGFLRVYKNGVLFVEVANANLNGSVDMANAWVEAGGYYTKLTWLKSGGGCGEFLGDGTDNGPLVPSGRCPCPNQCPPDGVVPVFKRYVDDIIVLKK